MAPETHLALLGLKAQDCVTELTGVITCVSFDLFGCIQVILSPPAKDGGEIPQGAWLDITRLKILDDKPVMAIPEFRRGYVSTGKKGAASKPPSRI